MISKVWKTIQQHGMLGQGESVTIGLSGGADSVALLLYLHSICEELKLSLKAVHINHNLRGEESQRDQEFAVLLANKFKIPIIVESFPIESMAKEQGISIEECARNTRYAAFEKHNENGKIATAHTLSDSIETTLFNLARGTAISGLTGIPPTRGKIIRPLIACTREEIEQYLKEKNQDYVTDSTNLTTDYSRNLLRHRVVPVLKEINPKLEQQIEAAQQLLQIDADYLEKQAQIVQEEIKEADGCSIKEYLKIDVALQGRVLIALLKEHQMEYSKNRIAIMQEMIIKKEGVLPLSENIFFCSNQNYFWITKKKILQEEFSVPFSIQKEQKSIIIKPFPSKTVQITQLDCEEIENIAKNNRKALKNLVDYDKIDSVMTLRSRKAGDQYQPYLRGMTKTMRKLFNEAKLSAEERSKLVIFANKDCIYWVEGFGVSQQVAVSDSTRRALLLEIY